MMLGIIGVLGARIKEIAQGFEADYAGSVQMSYSNSPHHGLEDWEYAEDLHAFFAHQISTLFLLPFNHHLPGCSVVLWLANLFSSSKPWLPVMIGRQAQTMLHLILMWQ